MKSDPLCPSCLCSKRFRETCPLVAQSEPRTRITCTVRPEYRDMRPVEIAKKPSSTRG